MNKIKGISLPANKQLKLLNSWKGTQFETVATKLKALKIPSYKHTSTSHIYSLFLPLIQNSKTQTTL